MIDTIISAVTIFGYVLSGITSIYYLAIALTGWFRKKDPNHKENPHPHRFVVVIAAHNEKFVIGNTLDSLIRMDYPRELIDIYVVADNCSDNTAEIAREKGVYVYERFDNVKKGKGYALTWIFEIIWSKKIPYEAVCILDADNLMDKNYFSEMNKSLNLGHTVIQGYRDCKNPEDSIVSGCYAITYWLNNRYFQLSRYQMGLSCSISGTGFVVNADLMKELGWDSHCLTEDLEFQLKIVERGIKVAWNHDAIFYDENPITIAQSFKQRTRWMQGHTACVSVFLGNLIKKGFKEKDPVALDTSFYLIQPYLLSIVWIITIISIAYWSVMSFVSLDYLFTAIKALLSMEVLMLVYGISLFIEKKLTKKILLYLIIFPFYLFTWLGPIYLGWVRRKHTEWAHTEHTRAVDVNDIRSE